MTNATPPTNLQTCRTCDRDLPADDFAAADQGRCRACAVGAVLATDDTDTRARSLGAQAYLSGYHAGREAERAAIRQALREKVAAR